MKYLFCVLVYFIFSISLSAQTSLPELYLKGKEELKAKKYAAAEKSFYQSILQNKDADSYYQLGKLYLEKREPTLRNQGYEYSTQALRLDPGNLEYNYLYLEYLSSFGSTAKREKEYWKIFNKDPKQALALFKIAEIKFENYEKYRANKVDTELWFTDEDVIPFDLTKFVKADLDTSEILYLKGLKIDSTNLYGLFGIVKMYQSTPTPGKAIEYLQRITRHYPDNKDGHLLLGIFNYKKKQLDASFKELQIAIGLMDEEEKEDFTYNSVLKMLESKYVEPFKKMNKDDKVALLEKYWMSMDPLYLSKYNERIMEHYARVAYSNYMFSVPDIDLLGWKSDRGQVYIRYGEPQRKQKIRQNIRLDRDLRSIGLVTGYEPAKRTGSKIAESGNADLIINTTALPSQYIEIWEYNNLPGFCFTGDKNYYKFMVTNEFEEIWRKSWRPRKGGGVPSMLDSRSTINSLKDYENVKAQKIQTYKPLLNGTRMKLDSKVFNFNKLVPGENVVETYVAYLLPTKDSTNQNEVKDFTHEIGVFFFDENYNPVIQVKDTIPDAEIRTNYPDFNNPVKCIGFGLRPRKVSLAFELRRLVDSNYYTSRSLFNIPKYNNQTIGISDLVSTNNIKIETDLPFGIKRGDYNFYPSLNNKYKNKEQFYIYYEIYNLQKDEKKETNFEQVITIKPKGEEDLSLKKIVKGITTLFSGEEGKISLTTDYKTKDENTQIYLQLDISEYKPGIYDLIVTINDKISGKSAEKKMDLEIYQ